MPLIYRYVPIEHKCIVIVNLYYQMLTVIARVGLGIYYIPYMEAKFKSGTIIPALICGD